MYIQYMVHMSVYKCMQFFCSLWAITVYLPRASSEVFVRTVFSTAPEPSKHHHKVVTDDDLMPKGLVLYDHTPRNQEEISVKVGV